MVQKYAQGSFLIVKNAPFFHDKIHCFTAVDTAYDFGCSESKRHWKNMTAMSFLTRHSGWNEFNVVGFSTTMCAQTPLHDSH